MAERKSKKAQPRRCRATSPAAGHDSRVTRIHRSLPGRMCEPTTASPSSVVNRARIASRCSSASGAGASTTSADDNGITLPALGGILVEDALLQQDDAFEQRLGPGRAAGDVAVAGDELVEPIDLRVRVPVGAATVGVTANGDHVLG